MAETIENYTPQVTEKPAANNTGLKVWLVLFFLSGVWLALMIAPPLLKQAGFETAAADLYYPFGFICHQKPERSFHIFDEKLGVCARCFGVYAGLLLGFVFYPFFRSLNDIRPMRKVWLFLACVPITLDWGLTFFHIWENTHLSRFFTGAVLGAACAIYIMPALVEIVLFLKARKRKTLSKITA
jgi:uncharacterized membrane protein